MFYAPTAARADDDFSVVHVSVEGSGVPILTSNFRLLSSISRHYTLLTTVVKLVPIFLSDHAATPCPRPTYDNKCALRRSPTLGRGYMRKYASRYPAWSWEFRPSARKNAKKSAAKKIFAKEARDSARRYDGSVTHHASWYSIAPPDSRNPAEQVPSVPTASRRHQPRIARQR